MELHRAVAVRLDRLAPDQRAAATAPPGPILCVAPAGSGKTTTLVARVAWLVDMGADPATICAITFNKRASEELGERLGPALSPLGVPADGVRVRTFHALGREILVDAGVSVDPLIERDELLGQLFPRASPADRRRLDTAFSRLKLDLAVTAAEIRASIDPGPVARAFVAYEEAIAAAGGVDFDDLVARTVPLLESDGGLLARWRGRCAHLLVDEAQDVDRTQLRLALVLAAPANRIFLVGDDDQSIYGWRLADVRRVLGLGDLLPGLRRVDLVTNYRCPRPVVERAVRLIEWNTERFAKRIQAGPRASGRLVLAPDASDDAARAGHVLDSWPDDEASRAILARTNRELLPAVAVALERGIPFRPPRIQLLLDAPCLDEVLSLVESTPDGADLLAALEAIRRRLAEQEGDPAETDGPEADLREAGSREADGIGPPRPVEVAAAILAWAAPFPSAAALVAAIRDRRRLLRELAREDAALSLATAHASKGLEFDHVAVVGLEAGRFPSARSVSEALEPERALEEERRLAYVAWTRARRSLTLVYDPAAPSPFLLEAFSPGELGSVPGPAARARTDARSTMSP
ncbi:MAG TPA: ATP-dependent helicase [Candidatus Limnocylindrales bacterium]